jgi:hypothetical protein
MSQTELHFGKLRKVELKENKTIDDFFKEKLLEVGINDIKSYHKNWEDAFKDKFYEKYFIVNNVIWEVFDHIEKDDSDDIYEITKNPDGTLSFIMKFYNGGTCLSECIEEELERI